MSPQSVIVLLLLAVSWSAVFWNIGCDRAGSSARVDSSERVDSKSREVNAQQRGSAAAAQDTPAQNTTALATKPGASEANDPDSRKYGRRLALLIGCTSYPDSPVVTDLEGPINDVKLMRKLLVDYFEFADLDIVTLAEDAELRPTRENIIQGLERLITIAREGDQFMIHFSGHGTQQPDRDRNDEVDPEPDGMDEVFLPCDTGDWGKRGLANAIVDDELRDLFHRMVGNGASVWAVFDCCNSGTIARNAEIGGTTRERKREILPEKLIPREVLEEARLEARRRGANSRSPFGESHPLDVATDDKAARDEKAGGIVAVYAALSVQPTIEKYFPLDADPDDQTSYGLLTYHIYSVLSKARSTMSYYDLVQRIDQEYTKLGRSSPTPLVEGDDAVKNVLDVQSEQGRITSIQLTAEDGHLNIDAGAIHGMTVGSVLAVYPPAGSENADKPLGGVRIEAVQALTADVAPFKFDGTPKLPMVPRDELESGCRLKPVFIDYQLRKRKMMVESDERSKDLAETLSKQLQEFSTTPASMIELVDRPADADWLVRLDGDRVWLDRANDLVSSRNADGTKRSVARSLTSFGPAPNDQNSIDWITSSMQKIARAETLLSMSSNKGDGDAAFDVDVQMVKFRNKDDREGEVMGRRSGGIFLNPGDLVGFRILNKGRESIYVTVLFVDSEYGITSFFPSSKSNTVTNNLIASGRMAHSRSKVNDKSFGVERFVVIGVKADGAPIDFRWLGQDSIDKAEDLIGNERGASAKSTALAELFKTGLYRTGTRSGLPADEIDEHFIRTLSWTVVSD